MADLRTPWHLERRRYAVDLVGADGAVLAVICIGPGQIEDARAQQDVLARLLLTAPELLEALQSLVTTVSNYIASGCEDLDNSETLAAARAVLLRAALTQATAAATGDSDEQIARAVLEEDR